MTEVQGIGGRRTQLLDYLRNRIRYWKLKEEAADRKCGNYSLSMEHKEEIIVILRKSMYLLITIAIAIIILIIIIIIIIII